MTDLGRLEPFVVVTLSIAFAMPAKGSLRPGTAVHGVLGQGPLADHKTVVRPMLFIWPVLIRADIHSPAIPLQNFAVRQQRREFNRTLMKRYEGVLPESKYIVNRNGKNVNCN